MLRNPNRDGELIRRQKPEHRRDRLLHRILSRIRHPLRDNRIIERLNPLQHIRYHREFAPKPRFPGGDELVGHSTSVHAGYQAADRGAPPRRRRRRQQGADEEVVRERRLSREGGLERQIRGA